MLALVSYSSNTRLHCKGACCEWTLSRSLRAQRGIFASRFLKFTGVCCVFCRWKNWRRITFCTRNFAKVKHFTDFLTTKQRVIARVSKLCLPEMQPGFPHLPCSVASVENNLNISSFRVISLGTRCSNHVRLCVLSAHREKRVALLCSFNCKSFLR